MWAFVDFWPHQLLSGAGAFLMGPLPKYVCLLDLVFFWTALQGQCWPDMLYMLAFPLLQTVLCGIPSHARQRRLSIPATPRNGLYRFIHQCGPPLRAGILG